MNLRQVQEEVLKELFDGYVEHGGGSIFSIDEITDRHGINAHELGSMLKEEGLIKGQQFRPDSMVCAISIPGIFKVDPYYFDNHISTIISTLGATGNDWLGIREILQWEPQHDMRARDIAQVMDDMGLVEILYRDDVFVKLNIRGQQYYEDRKPQWGNQ